MNNAADQKEGRRIYWKFSRREIPSDICDEWRQNRWTHNRRFLKICSILGLVAAVLLTVRRLFMLEIATQEAFSPLFLLSFAIMAAVSAGYLIFSTISSGWEKRRWKEVVQRIFILLFLGVYCFLSYLSMLVAPDYSTFVVIIMFMSVAFWMDTLSYFFHILAVILFLLLANRIGIHEDISVSELFMEVSIYAIIGSSMFYAVNEVRTRNFINSTRLETTIDELRELSLRDPLTRLFNRRMMNEELDRATALSQRISQPMTIILIDVDHFKRVNDSLGHSTGDEVLRQCADRLVEVVRESDRVYRFGGEEFILLLPDTCLPSAEALARRLLTRFSETPFDGVPWPITISMGIADNTERSIPSDLIKLADSRMYAAKQAGRNRFVSTGLNNPSDGGPEIP